MASNSSRFRSLKTLLLNQPSILLLGLSTILAFMALTRFKEEEQKWLVYMSWGSIFLFIFLWRVLRWYLSPADFSQNKDVIDILVKITGGAVVVLTIYFSLINFKLTQKTSNKTLEVSEQTLESSQSQKTNEQFTKALEDLGGSTLFHHLAGIYSFRRLDQEIETEKDYNDRMKDLIKKETSSEVLAEEAERRETQKKIHWEIMDILTHFIQQHSPIKRPPENSEPSTKVSMETVSTNQSEESAEESRDCPVDIYAILKLIGARRLTLGSGETEALNLINTDLRGCNFRDGNFQGANFENVNFAGATMENVNLRGANLKRADFSGAKLGAADLTNATIELTSYYGANLTAVKFDYNDIAVLLVDENTKCPTDFRVSRALKCEPRPDYHLRR